MVEFTNEDVEVYEDDRLVELPDHEPVQNVLATSMEELDEDEI